MSLGGRLCYASVEGTDCRIYEPSPFDTRWFSHKFNGPGVRHEVAVSIIDGHIIWIHGPFPCGSHPDVNIFRLRMKEKLLGDEYVSADDGYGDERCVTTQEVSTSSSESSFLSRLRARHETVNRRLKQFLVISHRYRHDLALHCVCFHAVAQLTQLMIANGEPLFNM